MNFLWKRYSRSGSAPPWYYGLMAVAFIAVAIWAGAQRDWLVMAIAIAMVGITAGGARIMRSLRDGSATPRGTGAPRKDGDDE